MSSTVLCLLLSSRKFTVPSTIVSAILGQALVLLPTLPPHLQNNVKTLLRHLVVGRFNGVGVGGYDYQEGGLNVTDWLQHVNVTEWLHSIATEGQGGGQGALQGLTFTTKGVGLGYRQGQGQGLGKGLGQGPGQGLGQRLGQPGDVIVFYDVEVSEQGLGPPLLSQTYPLGDVAVPLRELLNWLPHSRQQYPWPYATAVTVMFNASSAHSIAAFRGEAVAAAFQRCYNQALANGTSSSSISSSSSSSSSLSTSFLDRTQHPNVTYVAKNHPLPLTATQG